MTPVDKAYRFFKIDPRGLLASQALLVEMAKFLDESGVFDRKRPGRPGKGFGWLAKLLDDAAEIVPKLRKKHGRKPKLDEIASALRKRFPEQYGGYSDQLRQYLSVTRVQKERPEEAELFLKGLATVLREAEHRRADQK